ncbi:ribosome-binding factor A [Candidatus Kaiserbacteria bacterium]|nr:ribosome-binding factor A [Candidatus Kaiserbacteria bacterium]
MSDRKQKVELEIQAYVATFIQHEANTDPLITITGIKISPDLKNCTVYFTTIPTDKQEDALIFLKRSGSDLRTFIKNKMKLKYIPHFSFTIDYGERHRQNIDEIVRDTGTKSTD